MNIEEYRSMINAFVKEVNHMEVNQFDKARMTTYLKKLEAYMDWYLSNTEPKLPVVQMPQDLVDTLEIINPRGE